MYNQKVVQRIERKKQKVEEKKESGMRYQMEDYFTEQNKWHCKYINNIFKENISKWQN